MICPDCGGLLIKTKIQCHDLSGWMYGYLCDCGDDQTYELTIHSDRDWTSEILLEDREETQEETE